MNRLERFPENTRKHSDFLGEDVEKAYAKQFAAGKSVGGIGDKGKDVPTGLPDVPFVQVKSSWEHAQKFLAESLKRKRFIPICIGEPGEQQEMIASLRQFGAWVGKDETNRNEILKKVATARKAILEIAA